MTPSLPLVRRIIPHSYYRGLTSIVVLFAVLAVLILPSVTHAAEGDGWQGLVPKCGTKSAAAPAEGGGGATTVTYTPCSTCDLAALVKGVLDFVWKYVVLTGVALMLMIGGFQMVTGALSGSAASHQKGLATIKNAFIGLAIVFFAWLAIDTVIKFVAQQSLTGGGPAVLFERGGAPVPDLDDSISSTETAYGFWNQLKCAKLNPVPVTTKPPPPSPPAPTLPAAQQQPASVGGPTPQCAITNNACSPQVLQEFGYTPAQANVMSCIAMKESGGLPTLVNPDSGACGTFQILPSNWRNPNLHEGGCSTRTDCRDVGCNTQTALLLSQRRVRAGQSPYSDWVCPGCDPNGRGQACINRYDPG